MHALASPTTIMRATTMSPGALTRPPRWLAPLVLAYAHLAQLSFLGTLAAGLVFMTGAVPGCSVDGPARRPPGEALLVNMGLLLAFGIQHSVMAREGFKQAWTRLVPAPIERSTYVVLASLVLVALMAHHAPMPAILWHLEGPVAWGLWALFGAAGAATLGLTFAISHLEYLGVAQARAFARGERPEPPELELGGPYGWVRHPMITATLAFLWITPHMSLGHLVLALGFTAYALIGTALEERSLLRLYGDAYARYQRLVPRLVPRPWRLPSRRTAP